MSNSKALKRLVRARMEKTGESYMAAMRALVAGGSADPTRAPKAEKSALPKEDTNG